MSLKLKRTYWFIYKTTNHINGKIYVGQRKTRNLNDGYLGSGVALHNAIRKYGKANFYREILEFCTRYNINEREIYWIGILNARVLHIGYNIREGGCQTYIECQSEESNKKRSIAHKGKNFNPPMTSENRQKARERMLGDKNPAKKPENRLKISLSKTGISRPASVVEQVRLANIGKKDSKEAIQRKSEARKKHLQTHLIWNKGLTKETSLAMLQSSITHQGCPSWNKGLTKETNESLKKASEKLKGKSLTNKHVQHLKESHILRICSHCGKQGKGGGMIRFHFDNCKRNPAKNIINTNTQTG